MTPEITIRRVANGWVVHPPIHSYEHCGRNDCPDWHVYNTVEQLTEALPELLGCPLEADAIYGSPRGVPRIQT